MTYRIPYSGNLEWLVPRTILFTLFGSRAYGTDCLLMCPATF